MVYTTDPLHDRRWEQFLSRHSSASLFHSRPWLEAVRRTYGYKPIVYTTSPPAEPLTNGIVLCEINSWITGRRMVSVPFSDHCEPLLDNADRAVALVEELKNSVDARKWKYVELRPSSIDLALFHGAQKAPACYLHMLDLRPAAEEILRRTHKTAIQQPIRRAEREGLVYECGNSEHLLKAFYRLMVQTRRRKQLPPQPIEWFRNLADCFGDRMQFRLAWRENKAAAAIVTLQHKSVLVYKYGCSDTEFHTLGATPLLLWRTVLEAKAAGLTCMDFGRSDANNPGLIQFKDRWGTRSSLLAYVRLSRNQVADVSKSRSSELAKRLFSIMPDALLEITGRLLYRHVG